MSIMFWCLKFVESVWNNKSADAFEENMFLKIKAKIGQKSQKMSIKIFNSHLQIPPNPRELKKK